MQQDNDDARRLERSLWAVILGFSRRDVAAGLTRHAGHALTPASWSLLEHLDSLGPMRVSDIAACHGVDVSSVTPRLQALEREGLIARGADPHDRRASVISIGPAGRLALERLRTARGEILAEALAGARDEHVAIASALLMRIADHLKSRSAEGT